MSTAAEELDELIVEEDVGVSSPQSKLLLLLLSDEVISPNSQSQVLLLLYMLRLDSDVLSEL